MARSLQLARSEPKRVWRHQRQETYFNAGLSGSAPMESPSENQIPAATSGMDRLVEKYRRQFRIPENLNYYSEGDFHLAEREYLRFCLSRGAC